MMLVGILLLITVCGITLLTVHVHGFTRTINPGYIVLMYSFNAACDLFITEVLICLCATCEAYNWKYSTIHISQS